jgi:sterol desaturase/sphingolipid hydroxylase (fatty acid hydroxylase superfamily)
MLHEWWPDAVTGKIWLVPFIFAILFAMERLFPMAEKIGGLLRIAKNLALSGFNFLASPLIVIPITTVAVAHQLDWRPAVWSGWTGLMVDLLLLDLWIYWWHRANHRLPFLWRFHEVHHLDETLDTTSALRFHFGEVILSSLVRAALIYVLAMPLTSVVVFETVVLVSALFHHSNLRMPVWFEKPLSAIIVTPGIHWVHHHAKRADTDSNYSTILSFWDLLFRSRSATRRTVDMPIGVERGHEKSLAGLIAKPFQR